eukprot:GILJ01006968.1.p1 GENE.GILJ01006968.1~~GILJ01006968.1.p1  ORF type:complete len:656 (-),score=43.23 GILJ01006968.1:188-2155(-)
MSQFQVEITATQVVNEKRPFTVYAVQLDSRFSRRVVYRRFKNFSQLHYQLLEYEFLPVPNTTFKLGFLIPELPTKRLWGSLSERTVRDRIVQLQVYCRQLLGLLHFTNGPWCPLIADFFELEKHALREQRAGIYIQRAYRRFRGRQLARTLCRKWYRRRGFVLTLAELPPDILLYILGNLDISGLCTVASVCRAWHTYSLYPVLWRSVTLFPRRSRVDDGVLECLSRRCRQLVSLDLRYCDYLTENSMRCIAEFCDRESLIELRLDGCERVNDPALWALTGYCPSLETIASMELPPSFIFSSDSFSTGVGARGLQTLSMCECRNVQDAGVKSLALCTELRHLNLLGCFNVSDIGIQAIADACTKLETVNLGGTRVTGQGLDYLRSKCPNLKLINIMGCKFVLGMEQQDRLREVGVTLEAGEDTFRFYLVPHSSTDLPRITTSVLKTRSTLSMQRVYRYLLRKLNMDLPALPGGRDGDTVSPDMIVEIFCGNSLLPLDMPLFEVKSNFWSGEDLLMLHYRRRIEEVVEEPLNYKMNSLPAPPTWVPDQEALSCMDCDTDFSIWNRRHHCRACGGCFCARCSSYRCPVLRFGYTEPVRVCDRCFTILYQEEKLELDVKEVSSQEITAPWAAASFSDLRFLKQQLFRSNSPLTTRTGQ